MALVCVVILVLKSLEIAAESLRLLLYVNGRRLLGSFLAFVDVLLGLAALGFVVQNLNNVYAYLAYAFGYVLGLWVGSVLYDKIEEKRNVSTK